jgi:hypothetical protein
MLTCGLCHTVDRPAVGMEQMCCWWMVQWPRSYCCPTCRKMATLPWKQITALQGLEIWKLVSGWSLLPLLLQPVRLPVSHLSDGDQLTLMLFRVGSPESVDVRVGNHHWYRSGAKEVWLHWHPVLEVRRMKEHSGRAWWCLPVMPALRSQKDYELVSNLDYIVS